MRQRAERPSARSGKRVKELEERLARQAAELKRAKDDLANQGQEQETLDIEFARGSWTQQQQPSNRLSMRKNKRICAVAD